MPRSADQAYAELIQRIKEYSLLGSCAGLLGWDERTYMPRQGSVHRAEQQRAICEVDNDWAVTL